MNAKRETEVAVIDESLRKVHFRFIDRRRAVPYFKLFPSEQAEDEWKIKLIKQWLTPLLHPPLVHFPPLLS